MDVFQFRSLGPCRGERLTALASIASQPSTFYIGATGEGFWKSEAYGISGVNVSDGSYSTPSFGSTSIAQNDPNII